MKRRNLLRAATGSAGLLIAGSLNAPSLADATPPLPRTRRLTSMPKFVSSSPHAKGLVQIGETAIVKEDAPRLRAYFADDFIFHGPGGDLTFTQLAAYFVTLRAAFDGFTIERAQLVGEGEYLASRTVFSGVFAHVFTQSPVGRLEPNGKTITWTAMNIFRFASDGKLAEEWVQSDYRGFVEKLTA